MNDQAHNSLKVDEILRLLRNASITPPSHEDYRHNPDAAIAFNRTREHCIKATKFTDQEIESIIVFILDLIAIPPGMLEGVLLAKPCIGYVARCTFREIEENPYFTSEQKCAVRNFRPPFLIVFRTLFRELQVVGLDAFLSWPDIDKSYVTSYHLTAYKESLIAFEPKKRISKKKIKSGRRITRPYLYLAYGFFFHKKLRQKLRGYSNIGTLRKVEEVARQPFEFASTAKRQLKDLPVAYSSALKEDWLLNYRQSGRNRERLASVMEEDRRKFFEWFLSDREGHSHAFKIRRLLRGGEEPDDTEAPDGDTETRSTKPKAVRQVENDEQRDFEPPVDVFNQPDVPDDFKKNRFRSWQAERPHNRFVPQPWELKPLQLNHYAIIYDELEKITVTSPPVLRASTLFYRILIHTGINPGDLLDLEFAGPESSPKTLDLSLIGDRYYILNPAVVALKGMPSEFCFPVSEKVHIPLPPEISKYLPNVPPGGGYVFSYRDPETPEIRRLTKDDIIGFWIEPPIESDRKKRRKRKYKHGICVTPANVAYSFYSLYKGLFRLDPIIACHISGIDHRLLYGPQLHYIHVPHERLEKEYLETFYKVDRTIRAHHSTDRSKKSAAKVSAKSSAVVPRTDLPGYGSSAVPFLAHVKAWVAALDKAVVEERTIFKRHNLYMSYVYLAVQFATMLRPHVDPKLFWYHYNSHTGTLTIADKDSRLHYEERVLRLPGRVRQLLDNLRNGQSDFHKKRHVRCLSRQHSLSEKIFFTVKENGSLARFEFDNVVKTFKTLNIDLNVPSNMGRHFTRTWLHQNHVSDSMASVWAGHTRKGREAASVVSNVTLSDVVEAVFPALNAMLDELGFRVLEYMPHD
jgi:hypothetical protein